MTFSRWKPFARVAPLDVPAVRQSKLFASLCASLCAGRIVDARASASSIIVRQARVSRASCRACSSRVSSLCT